MQQEKFEIETIIEEIQGLLDSCDTKKFDSTKLIVPSDPIYDLLAELKAKVPDEVDRYRKIIDQRGKIINGANADAKKIIEDANRQKDRLVDDNNIVIEAKSQAQYIIEEANREADRIIATARANANDELQMVTDQSHDIFEGTMYYTSDKLDEIERILDDLNAIVTDGMRSFESHVNESLTTIRQNRAELESTTFEAVSGAAAYNAAYDDNYEAGQDYEEDYNDDEQ